MSDLSWSIEAVDDLSCIEDFLSQDNPALGERVVKKIFDVGELVADNPFMGMVDGGEYKRKYSVTSLPYTIYYMVIEHTLDVKVMRVLHDRQRNDGVWEAPK